jgi:hypothetical protein
VYGDLAIGLAVTLDRWRTEVADDGRPLDLLTVESADRWARSIAAGLRFDHR